MPFIGPHVPVSYEHTNASLNVANTLTSPANHTALTTLPTLTLLPGVACLLFPAVRMIGAGLCLMGDCSRTGEAFRLTGERLCAEVLCRVGDVLGSAGEMFRFDGDLGIRSGPVLASASRL